MTTLARIPRTLLPTPTHEEFAAIDMLYGSYMALNDADVPMAIGEAPSSPMTLVHRAAVSAMVLLPGVSRTMAERIWSHMMRSGEPFTSTYFAWIRGEI